MSSSAVDQDLVAPHYSNRLLQGLLLHLEEAHGRELLEAIIDGAGVPMEHLLEKEGWVSTEYLQRLVLSVARHLYQLDTLPPHDHEMWQIWRRAGHANVRPGVVGALYPVIRALGSPNNLFRALPSFGERGNRLVELDLESARGGRAVLSARPREPGGWTSANCWDLVGMLEAAPRIWGMSAAKVIHAECMHDAHRPAARCVYHVSYETRRLSRVLLLLFAAVVGAGTLALVSLLVGAHLTPSLALAGASIAMAVEGWRRYVRSARAARRDLEQLGHVLEQADVRYARLWQDERQLRRSLLTARKLSGYLAPDLVEKVVEHPETELTLGGRLTRAAVLFSDIVGYTRRSEGRSPADVVEELNLYFSYVDPVFAAHDGVIDKRMGDGVMVVFVPREGESDRSVHTRAIRCAMDMLASLATFNAELARLKSPAMDIRIGIAAGELIQGNMGSPVRLEYTVIGDVVNVASRLETNASPCHALVVAELLDGADPECLEALDIGTRRSIIVKGRQEPIDVVELAPRSRGVDVDQNMG